MDRFDNLNRTGSVALGGSTPSDGGSAWSDLTSSFSTGLDGGSGEVVCFESSPASNNIASLDAGTPDAMSEVEYIRIDDQAAAAVRIQDADNLYFFMSTSGGVTSLWKRFGSSFTKLADGSISFTPAVGQTLGCSAVGSTIKGYVNGVEAASAVDTDIATGNRHGWRTSTGFQFANSVTITDLSGGGGGLSIPVAVAHYRQQGMM